VIPPPSGSKKGRVSGKDVDVVLLPGEGIDGLFLCTSVNLSLHFAFTPSYVARHISPELRPPRRHARARSGKFHVLLARNLRVRLCGAAFQILTLMCRCVACLLLVYSVAYTERF